MASVIGRQFLVRLLARVAGLSHRLDGLLRELQALEIIYEQGLVPEPAYIFKHAVIQDVAYNSLLMQRRKALHRAVGEAIEELYQDRLEEHYTELAHHFSQGEVWDKALGYLRHPPAVEQAEASYRQALALAETLGMRALQAHCHCGLGILYAQLGRSGQARAELAVAIDLYRAMEMTFWLPRAETALAQMEGQ
jgi:predicted ATPase